MKKTGKTKRIMALVMCVVLMISYLSIFVSAATGGGADTAEPQFNVIGACSCALIINGINSTSNATLQTSVSTNLKITMELQKKKSGVYTTVETWTKTATGSITAIEKDRLINILSTYRLRVTFEAGNETHVKYASPIVVS